MVVECPGIIPNHTHSASFVLHKTIVGQSFIWCVEAIVHLNGGTQSYRKILKYNCNCVSGS